MTAKININASQLSTVDALEIPSNAGFHGVFRLGLLPSILGKDRKTLATDSQGVREIKERLELTVDSCAVGVASIGDLLQSAKPEQLNNNTLHDLGILLENVGNLAKEASEELSRINFYERVESLKEKSPQDVNPEGSK